MEWQNECGDCVLHHLITLVPGELDSEEEKEVEEKKVAVEVKSPTTMVMVEDVTEQRTGKWWRWITVGHSLLVSSPESVVKGLVQVSHYMVRHTATDDVGRLRWIVVEM